MAFSKKRSMVCMQGKWGGEYNAAAGGFIQIVDKYVHRAGMDPASDDGTGPWPDCSGFAQAPFRIPGETGSRRHAAVVRH